jgi:hypothetical protein
LIRLIGPSRCSAGSDTFRDRTGIARRADGTAVARRAASTREDATLDLPTNLTADRAGSTAARECAAIARDLERLTALIADAGDKLLVSFNRVSEIAPRVDAQPGDRAALAGAIGSAVTALQFQDMATQLTQHAQRRLVKLEQALSTLAAEAHDPLDAPTRMQPVRQTGMGAGSIDLF